MGCQETWIPPALAGAMFKMGAVGAIASSQGEAGIKAMLEARYQKYRKIGSWQELSEQKLDVAELSGIL